MTTQDDNFPNVSGQQSRADLGHHEPKDCTPYGVRIMYRTCNSSTYSARRRKHTLERVCIYSVSVDLCAASAHFPCIGPYSCTQILELNCSVCSSGQLGKINRVMMLARTCARGAPNHVQSMEYVFGIQCSSSARLRRSCAKSYNHEALSCRFPTSSASHKS